MPDNDATRGMVRQVRFLVSVEEVSDAVRAKGESVSHSRHQPSEARADAPASHRSEDSEGSDSQENQ